MGKISKKWFEFKNKINNSDGSAKVAELFIYGEITSYKWDESDVTASGFKEELDKLDSVDQLDIFINSPGGSVFQGQAILSMLNRFKEKNNSKIRVVVDGIAASTASFIAMSGDIIEMPDNAMLMIHNAWVVTMGNSEDLRKTADDLDKVNQTIVNAYLSKAKVSEDKLKALMDEESWLNAKDAAEIFNIEIIEAKNIAANIKSLEGDLERFKNTPTFEFIDSQSKNMKKKVVKIADLSAEKEAVEEVLLRCEVINRLDKEW